MDNKIKKGIISIVFIISGVILYSTTKNDVGTDINTYLQLDNIEALAASEGSTDRCYESGSIDCSGYKAKHKVTIYSFPLDK